MKRNEKKRVSSCWHWPQLFTLPALAISQLKLEHAYKNQYVTERPLPISNGQSKLKQGLTDFPMLWRKISLIEFSKR